jgi:hypothetical protein
MVTVLTSTPETLTYAWFCPVCFSVNICDVFRNSQIMQCPVCSLRMINIDGRWKYRRSFGRAQIQKSGSRPS